MSNETINLIKENKIRKGSVLTTSKIAGILADKQTDKLILLCHTIGVDIIDLYFDLSDNFKVTSILETTGTKI